MLSTIQLSLFRFRNIAAFPKKFLATMNLQTDKKGMTSNDWIKRWENKTKIIRWQLNEVHPFIIKHAPSSKTHTRVLVPLAGKTVDLLWLLEKGFQVIGIECSTAAVEELFDEYISKTNYTIDKPLPTCTIYSAYNKRLMLVVCDIFDRELIPSLIGGPVSFVWDRAALTALHPANHVQYIEKLKQLSQEHAEFLIGVYWHPERADQGPPFAISAECIAKLFPNNHVIEVDDIDAKNERWADTSYEQLRERCYRVII